MADGDKQTILESVRANLAIARDKGSRGNQTEEIISSIAAPTADIDQHDLAEQFARELTAVGAQVMNARTTYGVQGYIRDIIHHHKAQRIAVSEAPALASHGLDKLLKQTGKDVIALPQENHPGQLEDYKRRLMDADIGITGVDFGLADSGTLVLQTSTIEGRLASLLPPVHVALISVSQILPAVGHLITGYQLPPGGSDLILITGPSRTADIELTLTVGVHGPKELYVLVVEST